MRIPILAVFACLLVQPLACSHQSETPAYGSDINDHDNASEGQPGAAPSAAGGDASTKEGPSVGGTNTTGATGGSNGTGGTSSTAGSGATGGTGAYTGGTSP